MPAVDVSIFEKYGTGTPARITEAIKTLCREISPDHAPGFVVVALEADSKPHECFYNVKQKIARDRGHIVYGWAIWEWPRVFLEAEHHAVWSDGDRLVDVTPHVPASDRILFLPDPQRVYDYVTKKRILNVKRSLGNFPSVERWIEAIDRMQQYMEDNSKGSIVTMNEQVAAVLYQEARMAQAQILVDLARATGRNEPCFCRSGRKFKKCCEPLIDLNA